MITLRQLTLRRGSKVVLQGASVTINHGERIAAEIGVAPDDYRPDLSGIKASFGVDAGTEALTYAELQERREVIRRRFAHRNDKLGVFRR